MSVSILKLLNGNDFISINRTLAKNIGLHEAIMLSEISCKHDYFESNYLLQEFDGISGWFYLTSQDVEDRTTLTRKQQDKSINNLISLGFIEVKVKGVPPRRFFNINLEAILSYFARDASRDKIVNKENNTNLSEKYKLNCPKSTNQNVPFGQILYKDNETRVKRPDGRKDNVYESIPDTPNPKTLLSKNRSKTLETARRYSLNEEQQGVLSWLREHCADVDENTLSYWSKTYDFDRISKVYHEAKSRKPKSLGAYMTTLFKRKSPVPNASFEECQVFAKEFLESSSGTGWKIYDTHVTLKSGRATIEVVYTNNPVDFARDLKEKLSNLERKHV